VFTVGDPKQHEISMVQEVLMKLMGGDRSDVFGSGGEVSAFLTLAVDGGEYFAVGLNHSQQRARQEMWWP